MRTTKQHYLVLLTLIISTASSTGLNLLDPKEDFTDSISSAIMTYELDQMPYYTIISYYDAVSGKECNDTTVIENGWSPYNHSIRTKCGISELIDIKSNDTIYLLESPFEGYTGYYWNATSSVLIKESFDYDNKAHMSMENFDVERFNKNSLIHYINQWDTCALLSKKCPQIKDTNPFRLTRVIVSDSKIISICGIWITLECWTI